MKVEITPPQVSTLPQLNSEEPTMLTILTAHNYLQPVSELNDLQTHLYMHNVHSYSPPPTPVLHPLHSHTSHNYGFILFLFYITCHTSVAILMCAGVACVTFILFFLSQVSVSEFSAVHIHILLPNCYNSLSARLISANSMPYQLYFGGLHTIIICWIVRWPILFVC